MPDSQQIAIYGAGGFAREIAWLLTYHEKAGTYDVVGFIEDGTDSNRIVNNKPVFSWEEFQSRFPNACVVVALGSPQSREKLANKCATANRLMPPLVHHSVELSEFVTIGEGSIICSGSILTVNIAIGRQVHINLDCTIGHDVTIGDFTTISPGVHISGRVRIGRNVFIGSGATIIDGTDKNPLIIADGTVIAAGACVTKSTEPNSLYAGVPATLKKRL